MYLPVTMEIIKGILRLVDPGALRSGDTMSVTHQGEPGAGVPRLIVSLPPLQRGFCRVGFKGSSPPSCFACQPPETWGGT